jgi:hypothetical protein
MTNAETTYLIAILVLLVTVILNFRAYRSLYNRHASLTQAALMVAQGEAVIEVDPEETTLVFKRTPTNHHKGSVQ